MLLLWLLLFASDDAGGVIRRWRHYSVRLLTLHLLVDFVEVLELIVFVRYDIPK